MALPERHADDQDDRASKAERSSPPAGIPLLGALAARLNRDPRSQRARELAFALAGLGALIWALLSVHEHPLNDAVTVISWILGVIACVGYVVWAVTHETRRIDELTLRPLPLVAAGVMGLSGAVLTGLTQDPAAIIFGVIGVGGLGVFLPPARALSYLVTTVIALVTPSLIMGHSGSIGTYIGVFTGIYAISSGRRGYIQRAMQAERLVAETERANAEQSNAATLAERTRVAREIHDVLAHSLAALSVQLEVADALMTDGHDLPRAHDYVNRAQRVAREGLTETRRAIAALRDDKMPLPELLSGLAESYQFETEMPATVVVRGEQRRLGNDIGLTLYRTAQEALTNVRKHAPGAAVDMVLRYDATMPAAGASADAVELRIHNTASEQATGDLHTAGGGYGLTGMRERAELLRGELIAGATASGWEVVVRVPYHAAEPITVHD